MIATDAAAPPASTCRMSPDQRMIRRLADLPLAVRTALATAAITGGITPADLPLFKEINVKAFIAGRALSGAANPQQVAEEFHARIRDIWGA